MKTKKRQPKFQPLTGRELKFFRTAVEAAFTAENMDASNSLVMEILDILLPPTKSGMRLKYKDAEWHLEPDELAP